MNSRVLKVLVDTNIWIDYYTGRDGASGHSSMLIKELLCSKHQVLVSALTTKDVFYLLQVYLKLAHRKQYNSNPSTKQALAIREVAWKSLQHMVEAVEVLAVDTAECNRALVLREIHGDYEDNLQVACAESNGVDYLVTNNKSLHAPETVAVASPSQLYSELFNR